MFARTSAESFSLKETSKADLRELCDELQSLSKRTPDKQPFFISSRSRRGPRCSLSQTLYQWPPMAALGKIDSPTVAFKVAQAIGAELRAVGVNMSFAPSIDIFTKSRKHSDR